MPIRKEKSGWFYGSQGPFPTREKAVEVAAAIHAEKDRQAGKGLRYKKKKRG